MIIFQTHKLKLKVETLIEIINAIITVFNSQPFYQWYKKSIVVFMTS